MNIGVMTEWSSAEDLVGKLEVGNLLEFKSDSSLGDLFPKHWAVYMGIHEGEHTVGHLVTKDDLFSTMFFSGSIEGCTGIRIHCLFKYSEEYKCRINNSSDHKFVPRPVNDIVSFIFENGKGSFYNLLFFNCKSFAKLARYDFPVSEQSFKLCSVIGGASLFFAAKIPLLAGILLTYGYYKMMKFIRDFLAKVILH
uniref:LRAT domain-containing protein n=1 Tax=Strongyloides venezuelensis TaxID=75913 RepID=A0A0K0FRJ2_STRVS